MTGATTDDDPLVAMIAALSAETTVLIDNHRLAVSSGDRLLIDRAKNALRDHLARMDAALNIIKTRLELRRMTMTDDRKPAQIVLKADATRDEIEYYRSIIASPTGNAFRSACAVGEHMVAIQSACPDLVIWFHDRDDEKYDVEKERDVIRLIRNDW